MAAGPSPARAPDPADAWPAEPGVSTDLAPPFVAADDDTRWLFSLNRFGIRPGLRRIEALLRELDHPEREVPTIVVAGTNGKGSTTRILATLLRGAGYRVGCFTSPHLLRVHERILVDDRPLAPERFATCVRRLRPAVERHEASWFETLTALALDVCREEKVDILCCETGLGGRLDATNALPALATVLVTVSLDHRRILGETIADICAEKLGLLKRDVPLFCAAPEHLRAQVSRAAVLAGSPSFFLDEQASWHGGRDGWRLTLRGREIDQLPSAPTPVLQRNIALALLCLDELAARSVLRPVPRPAAVLSELFLPGRFQTLLQRPDWILDTAHNAQALREALAAFLARGDAGRRLVFFGCLRDKELDREVGRFLKRCDGVVAAPIGLPRSRNPAELTALLSGWGLAIGGRNRVEADLGAAISFLARFLRSDDKVLVTGSCFLVAETLYRLGIRDLDETRRPRPAGELLAGLEAGC